MPDTQHYLDLGLRVAKYRNKLGMTQEDLAALLDLHQPDVSRIEGGHILPPMRVRLELERLANIKAVYWAMRETEIARAGR